MKAVSAKTVEIKLVFHWIRDILRYERAEETQFRRQKDLNRNKFLHNQLTEKVPGAKLYQIGIKAMEVRNDKR